MSEDDELPAQGPGAEHAAYLGRILALSDGVFAIAITLLVLDFTVKPGLSGDEFRDRLAALVPSGLAYALSVATIARFWTIHRLAFRGVVRSDGWLVAVNFVFLGLIAFLPFPTLVLGSYGDQLEGVLFYAACITATSLSSTALYWYVTGRPGLRPGVDPQAVRLGRVRFLTGTIVFLLSIPAALVDVRAAEAMWMLVFLVSPLVRLLVVRRGTHEKGTSPRLTP